MSERVEEQQREAKRIEEMKQALQRSEAKRSAERGEFKRIVASMQQSQAQGTAQDNQKQQQNSSAHNRLMARSGINNNAFSSKLGKEGDRRARTAAEKAQTKDAEMSAGRSALSAARAKQDEARGGMMKQSFGQKDPQSRSRDDKKDTRSSSESRREQLIASHAGIQTVVPLADASQKSSAAAGAQPLSPQQIVDRIVKSVRKGIDTHGNANFEVTLHDDVLDGVTLSLKHSSEGISLALHNCSPDVARLFTAGSTAKELSTALRLKGIRLKTLEVGQTKVLG